jgi:hypothetical protein
VLVYCADYRCGHSMAMNADHWPDDLRLSDIEPRFVCTACGKRGFGFIKPDELGAAVISVTDRKHYPGDKPE